MSKNRVPAIEGWFTTGDEPRLLGQKDPQSGSTFFPKDVAISRAPGYADAELEDVELSRRGTLWSYTTNHYQPPPPYESPDPFEPYTVVGGGAPGRAHGGARPARRRAVDASEEPRGRPWRWSS